uniref:Uncharacterized protein n=1 Tax=Anguilla anguilla TaxID=7936 RepID=A0A0E9R361_ANGAN
MPKKQSKFPLFSGKLRRGKFDLQIEGGHTILTRP